MNLFNGFETYSHDFPLLKKLGLKRFKGKVHEKVYVGEYKTEDGSWAKIWVEGAPAQFFSFKIYCSESKMTTTVSTGSGCLSGYWPFVEKIMDGMIVVEKSERK